MRNTYIGIAAIIVLLCCAGWVHGGFKDGHGKVVQRIFLVSAALAMVSVGVAVLLQTIYSNYRQPWSDALIAFWAALPPLWFFYEYAKWPPTAGIDDERMRHFHDLGRNIGLR